MKIKLFYDYRFLLLPIKDRQDERAIKIQGYVPAYSGEYYFRFVRTVSLPCLPVKEQIYQLAFDSISQTLITDDDTSHQVVESGFMEELNSERIYPYFVITHDRIFSEEIANTPIEKGSLEKQRAWWEGKAKSSFEQFLPILKRDGWEYYPGYPIE